MAELELLDWRRRIAALYARVRNTRDEDPQAAHDDWRTTRDRLFATSPETPLEDSDDFRGLPYAPYDRPLCGRLRSTPASSASDSRSAPAVAASWPSCASAASTCRSGRWTCSGSMPTAGESFCRSVTRRQATPRTAAVATSWTLPKDADLGSRDDGRVVLDFNFAYHPSCHYSPRWSCPLAPPGNWLHVPLPVGELALLT